MLKSNRETGSRPTVLVSESAIETRHPLLISIDVRVAPRTCCVASQSRGALMIKY